VHELLLPQSIARAEAQDRCRRYLAGAFVRSRTLSLFLPREHREDWIALLAWHRLGRELASLPSGFERRRALGELENELEAALEERPRSPIGLVLSFAIRRHELPEELLRRPLQEWKREESFGAFETREALLAHARALAVPEGRLFLCLAGIRNPRTEALTDALAIALQLTHWLVNLGSELERGRVRIPVDELARSGVELGALCERRPGPALEKAIAAQVAWTRSFYARGWDLCFALDPWRGRELCFLLRWHAASLAALELAGARVVRGPPPSGWLRAVACAAASAASRAAPKLS
jgi:phytoene/squalene synthetase